MFWTTGSTGLSRIVGAEAFMDDVTSAFDEIAKLTNSSWQENFPAMDAFIDESNGEMTLRFAVAGYKKEDLELVVADNSVIVKGKALKTAYPEKARFLRGKIKNSAFSRKYLVPAGKYDLTQAKASYADGILEVILPPTMDSKPRTLSIG